MKIYEFLIRNKYGKGIKNDIKIIKIIFTIRLHLHLRLVLRGATPLPSHIILSCDALLRIDYFIFTVIKFISTIFNNSRHT
jgi:hypothetical protein